MIAVPGTSRARSRGRDLRLELARAGDERAVGRRRRRSRALDLAVQRARVGRRGRVRLRSSLRPAPRELRPSASTRRRSTRRRTLDEHRDDRAVGVASPGRRRRRRRCSPVSVADGAGEDVALAAARPPRRRRSPSTSTRDPRLRGVERRTSARSWWTTIGPLERLDDQPVAASPGLGGAQAADVDPADASRPRRSVGARVVVGVHAAGAHRRGRPRRATAAMIECPGRAP